MSTDPGRCVALPRSASRSVALCLVALAACAPAAPESTGPLRLEPDPPLAAPAMRIVPSSARGLEFLSVLLGPERFAALPEQAFEYASLGTDAPAFARLPRFYAYLAESVLAFEPDLVVADPWQSNDTNLRLREAGVPLLILPSAENWQQSAEVLDELGRIFGLEERAREARADLEARVLALAEAGLERVSLRILPYSNFGAQGYSAGTETTLDEMIRLAGMRNAAAESGRVGNGTMSFEELLVLDPDVIVVSSPLHTPSSHAGDRGGAARDLLRAEPVLANLRAVREDRIVSMPPGLFACASQQVVTGAEVLAGEVDALLARLQAQAPDVQR